METVKHLFAGLSPAHLDLIKAAVLGIDRKSVV